MTQPPEPSAITGLILCGGAAIRMGGTDKGLALFHGRPLVDLALERLAPQVSRLMISANRNTTDYALRGHLVLQDPPLRDDGPSYEGPLAGILAGLRAVQTPWLAVIPCDSPAFPLNLVSRLSGACPDARQPRHVEGHQSFCLVPQTELKSLETFLRHGHRRLGQWLSEAGSMPVRFEDPGRFRNLNTPDDLAQA